MTGVQTCALPISPPLTTMLRTKGKGREIEIITIWGWGRGEDSTSNRAESAFANECDLLLSKNVAPVAISTTINFKTQQRINQLIFYLRNLSTFFYGLFSSNCKIFYRFSNFKLPHSSGLSIVLVFQSAPRSSEIPAAFSFSRPI